MSNVTKLQQIDFHHHSAEEALACSSLFPWALRSQVHTLTCCLAGSQNQYLFWSQAALWGTSGTAAMPPKVHPTGHPTATAAAAAAAAAVQLPSAPAGSGLITAFHEAGALEPLSGAFRSGRCSSLLAWLLGRLLVSWTEAWAAGGGCAAVDACLTGLAS